MPHIVSTRALGRRRRPGARLAALAATGAALVLQVIALAAPAQALPPAADLSVAMDGPSSARPGSVVDYSVTITNLGASVASGVVFDLASLPTGATYDVPTSFATCSGTHCTLVPDVAPAAVQSATIQVHTGTPLDDGSVITPKVTLAPSADNTVTTNDVAQQATELSNAGTLTVQVQRTSAGQLLPGERATFKITLTNNALNAARNAEVFARPLAAPASTRQSASSPGATCGPSGKEGVWSCRWTTIPAGESRVMTFNATASVRLLPGSFPLLAEAVSDNSDGAADGAWATVIDNNKRRTDVSVSTYTTPRVKANNKGSVRVTITNHGPYRAHDVVLVQTVPKGFVWRNPNGRVMVARETRTRSISFGDLEVGQSAGIDGWFRYPVGGTLTWTSRVTHSDPDGRVGNNADTAVSKVLGPVVNTVKPKGSVVQATTTSSTSSSSVSSSTSSSANAPQEQTIYDDAGRPISGPGAESAKQKELADTGGPARGLPVLGLTLALLGTAVVTGSRERRPAPRHKAWVSPYA